MNSAEWRAYGVTAYLQGHGVVTEYILSSICINLLFDFFAVSYMQELAALKRSDGQLIFSLN